MLINVQPIVLHPALRMRYHGNNSKKGNITNIIINWNLIAAFFVIGWTQISDDPAIQTLYLPMVGLFALGTFILIVLFFWWYLPYLGIELQSEWLTESLLFGIIVMIIQFLLDIVIFGLFIPNVDLVAYFFRLLSNDPQGSTIIIMYPLIVIWTIIAGFFVQKQKV
ncbi:MAG: hypothetical protein ACFE9L_18505 [Candidatus Hodarchaeota archaeon]